MKKLVISIALLLSVTLVGCGINSEIESKFHEYYQGNTSKITNIEYDKSEKELSIDISYGDENDDEDEALIALIKSLDDVLKIDDDKYESLIIRDQDGDEENFKVEDLKMFRALYIK